MAVDALVRSTELRPRPGPSHELQPSTGLARARDRGAVATKKKKPSPARKPTARAREDADRTAKGKTILVSHVREKGGDGTTQHVPPADAWVGEDGERIALGPRGDKAEGKATPALRNEAEGRRGLSGRDAASSAHLAYLRHDVRQLLVAADSLLLDLGEREAAAVLQALLVAVCDDDDDWRALAREIVKKASELVYQAGRAPAVGPPKKPKTRMFETLETYVRDSRGEGHIGDGAIAIAIAHGFLDLEGIPLTGRGEKIALVEARVDELAHADASKFVRNVARALGLSRVDNLTNASTKASSRAIRKKRRPRS